MNWLEIEIFAGYKKKYEVKSQLGFDLSWFKQQFKQ